MEFVGYFYFGVFVIGCIVVVVLGVNINYFFDGIFGEGLVFVCGGVFYNYIYVFDIVVKGEFGYFFLFGFVIVYDVEFVFVEVVGKYLDGNFGRVVVSVLVVIFFKDGGEVG